MRWGVLEGDQQMVCEREPPPPPHHWAGPRKRLRRAANERPASPLSELPPPPFPGDPVLPEPLDGGGALARHPSPEGRRGKGRGSKRGAPTPSPVRNGARSPVNPRDRHTAVHKCRAPPIHRRAPAARWCTAVVLDPPSLRGRGGGGFPGMHPQKRFDRRLQQVAKAVTVGYKCH